MNITIHRLSHVDKKISEFQFQLCHDTVFSRPNLTPAALNPLNNHFNHFKKILKTRRALVGGKKSQLDLDDDLLV
jgi:hypothetical protein